MHGRGLYTGSRKTNKHPPRGAYPDAGKVSLVPLIDQWEDVRTATAYHLSFSNDSFTTGAKYQVPGTSTN